MKEITKKILMNLYLDNIAKKLVRIFKKRNRYSMKFPPYDASMHNIIISSSDPVRYGMMALAINSIKKNNIDGNFAEVGVYRGKTSRFIHAFAPERILYLFDTFEGFPLDDLENNNDSRFKKTSIEIVNKIIGNLNNVIIRKGYFPETAKGLENELFAFVMLDLDKYKPTLSGLQFFYPRVRSGGYIFVHDYNSPESNWAISRAVNEFMKDKLEKLIEISDVLGSIVIRKI